MKIKKAWKNYLFGFREKVVKPDKLITETQLSYFAPNTILLLRIQTFTFFSFPPFSQASATKQSVKFVPWKTPEIRQNLWILKKSWNQKKNGFSPDQKKKHNFGNLSSIIQKGKKKIKLRI